MGIGAAFIFPTTLSILTNTFTGRERAKAIGVWAGVSGIGVALGPMLGGILVEHFDWGAVFFVNVPICAAALVLGYFFIPTSRDPDNRPLDPIGALLSILTLVALLYAIIQAPDKGWITHATSSASFIARADPARPCSRWWETHTAGADDRRARVPQRAVLGRLGGAHAHVVRALRLAVPAHPVLPVRPRLLAARSRAPRAAGGRRHDGDVAERAEARVPLGHEVGRRDRIAGDRRVAMLLLRLEHDHVVVRRRLRRCGSSSASVSGSPRRPRPSRSWGRCRRAAPAWARRSTTRRARPVVRSASPSSGASSSPPTTTTPTRRKDLLRGVVGRAARLGRAGARLRQHAPGQAGRGADRSCRARRSSTRCASRIRSRLRSSCSAAFVAWRWLPAHGQRRRCRRAPDDDETLEISEYEILGT